MKFILSNILPISRIMSGICLVYFGSILLESYKHQAWEAFALAFVYGGFATFVLINAGNETKVVEKIIEVEIIKPAISLQPQEKKIQIFEQSPAGEKYFFIPNGLPCVYLIQDVSATGYCKIGLSSKLNNRLSSLKTGIPMELKVIHVIKTTNMKNTEKGLHARFANQRISGEWFDLSQEDVDYIKSL